VFLFSQYLHETSIITMLSKNAAFENLNAPLLPYALYYKFSPYENYGDWELRDPCCRENLHYL
jgi:hypothetical protein